MAGVIDVSSSAEGVGVEGAGGAVSVLTDDSAVLLGFVRVAGFDCSCASSSCDTQSNTGSQTKVVVPMVVSPPGLSQFAQPA